MSEYCSFIGSTPFMPHGHCYLWSNDLITLHLASDALIVLAYYSIPFTLVYFVRRRRDIEFNWMFVCFAVFIMACGTTHLMEMWNIWHSDYWVAGAIKALTAAASVPTAVLLVRLVPQALALPSASQLNEANLALQKEVTERKRAESLLREVNEKLEASVRARTAELDQSHAALRVSEERFRLVVEAAPNAMIVADEHGHIVLVNAQAEHLFGYTRTEILGQPVELLVPVRYRPSHPDLRTGFFKHPQARAMGAGRDLFGRRKDGSEMPVEIGLNPVRTAEGDCVLASIIDITERKAAEEKLTASTKEVIDLKSALDEHAIVAITDPRGRITYVNDKFCAISKYSREELLGQDHRIINSGYHPPEFIRDLWGTIGRGRVWHGEIKNKAKDGSFYWVDTTIVPFLNASGKPRQYVAIRADITERKAAEETILRLNTDLEHRVVERTAQLEAANRELEAFSYSVSHDLRAPLRAIDGFSQAVLEDFSPKLPEEGVHYLQTIRQSAQRMGALIDDLLAFARLNRQELNKTIINTDALVRSALDELGSPWHDRKVDIRLRALPSCSGDPSLLKQVWLNILSNALKYTRRREQAVIEIGCEKRDGEDVFFVRDNGTGFDMRYANKLFGVFQRLHRIEDYEGTGVGLAIVQRVIHRHGGRVWAEAEPDHGATFYFTLEKNNSL